MKKTILRYSKFTLALALFLQMSKMNAQSCSTLVDDTFPTPLIQAGQFAAESQGWYPVGGTLLLNAVVFAGPQGVIFALDNNTYSQLNKNVNVPAGVTVTLKGVSWRNNVFPTSLTRGLFYVKLSGTTFLTIDTQGASNQPTVVANNGATVDVAYLPASSGFLSWTTPMDITINLPNVALSSGSLELGLQAGSSLASADDIAVQGVVVGTTTPKNPTASSYTNASCTPNGTIVFNPEYGIEYSINGGSTYQASNSFTGLAGGTYTLKTRRAGTSCVSGIDSLTLTAKVVPVANAGSAFTKTCVTNASGAQIGSTAVGGVTYSWAPATGLTDPLLSNPIANPTSNTTYTVTAKNTASGCTATASVLATVNTAAPAAPSPSTTSIANSCPTTSVNLNSLVSNTTNLKWYKESTHTTEVTTPTAVTTSGMYYPFYVATGGNGCYSDPTSTAVNATVTVCCAATTEPNLNK